MLKVLKRTFLSYFLDSVSLVSQIVFPLFLQNEKSNAQPGNIALSYGIRKRPLFGLKHMVADHVSKQRVSCTHTQHRTRDYRNELALMPEFTLPILTDSNISLWNLSACC